MLMVRILNMLYGWKQRYEKKREDLNEEMIETYNETIGFIGL